MSDIIYAVFNQQDEVIDEFDTQEEADACVALQEDDCYIGILAPVASTPDCYYQSKTIH